MKHFRPRLSRRAFWVLCALLVCLRLALTGFQQAYIWVGGAPLDDELMFRAANHITAGQWLGAYDYLTLSKAMFFPVWLALLHALHLPYLISGAACNDKTEFKPLYSWDMPFKERIELVAREVYGADGVDFSKPFCLGYTGLSDELLQKYIHDSEHLWKDYAKELPVSTLGATIGTHVGPGAIAVAFFEH